MKYRTKDGDVLDLICHKHYGRASWSIEAVYAANPGLAQKGAVLPAGLEIILPEAEDTRPASPTIRLWG